MKLHERQRRLLHALFEKTEARTPRGCAGPAMTVRTHFVLAGPAPPVGSVAAPVAADKDADEGGGRCPPDPAPKDGPEAGPGPDAHALAPEDMLGMWPPPPPLVGADEPLRRWPSWAEEEDEEVDEEMDEEVWADGRAPNSDGEVWRCWPCRAPPSISSRWWPPGCRRDRCFSCDAAGESGPSQSSSSAPAPAPLLGAVAFGGLEACL